MTATVEQAAAVAPDPVGHGPRRARLVAGDLGRGAVAGLVATLSVAPFGWWPAAFVGIALLARALVGRSWRRRVVTGYGFGLGLYVVSLWWMTQFSLPGGVFVGVLQSTFTGLAMAAVHPGRVRPGPGPSVAAHWRTWVTVPVALVLADAARSLWPFGGLPLGGLDLGQAGGPLLPLVAFGGRLLLVGVTAGIGAALAALAPVPRAGRGVARPARAGAALAAAALVGVVALAHVVPDGTRSTGTLRVAVVQGGGERGLRASPERAALVAERHFAASEDVPAGVDLVLWPEDVVDVEALAGSPAEARLSALARRLRATVVAGVVEDVGTTRFANFAVAFGPDGRRGDRFDKVRRVPYGEFFPGRAVIEGWGLAALPGRDAVAGTGPGVLRTPAGTFAVAISYEGFFDDRTRGGVRSGGEVVLVPTNAASYKTSHVPTQQVAAARLRAVETGRWVVQAAPTGYSAFVDERGRVRDRSVLGERDVLVRTVARRAGLTPYARWNDAPALALAAVVGALGWAGAAVRRERGTGAARIAPARH